jgi:hypothetical protein
MLSESYLSLIYLIFLFSLFCLIYLILILFLHPASSLAGRAPQCGGVARPVGLAMQWRVTNHKHSRRTAVLCPPIIDFPDRGQMLIG